MWRPVSSRRCTRLDLHDHSYADLALREFRRADDLFPQLVGNSFVPVEIMSSFVRNVNKFILGRVEDETFNKELFTEQLRMLSDTGFNLVQSSKSIWDVILDVFEWASVEACFGEPVYELYVIINWWLGKLKHTALVRNFQRRIASSKRTFDGHQMPDTFIHREVVYGNHAVDTFNERVLSTESTRLLAEHDWGRWNREVANYGVLDGWQRTDNMTELYVLREKIRHLLKWLRLWHSHVLERFVALWWSEYWDGGQRFTPFPSS